MEQYTSKALYVQREVVTIRGKMDNSIRYGLSNLLLLLSVFTYVCPVNFGFDTQPFALILSICVLLLSFLKNQELRMPGSIFVFLIMFLASCLYFIFSGDKFAAFRSLAGYLSIFVISLASYRTFKYIKVKWFNFSVYTYLMFAIMQLTVDKKFGDFLLPRMSTSSERGITSLAVEPSTYAIICIFLLVINDHLAATGKQSQKKYLFISVLLILQILLTLSGIALVFLAVYVGAKVIGILAKEGVAKHKGKLLLFVILITATFAAFNSIDVLESSRGGILLNSALKDPKMLLIRDGSIADRLTHAILPMYSLPYSKGVGLGMGTWAEHAINLRSYAGGFVELMGQQARLTTNRIMSGWGTAVYELGIVGLSYMVIFIRIIWRGSNGNNKSAMNYICAGITIWLMMFMAVPLAFPLFSYVMGMFMFDLKNKGTSEN